MKHIIEFNLPNDQCELDIHLSASKNAIIVEDIWNRLFRPAHKHGFHDDRINELLKDDKCYELFEKLEEIYRNLLQENE